MIATPTEKAVEKEWAEFRASTPREGHPPESLK